MTHSELIRLMTQWLTDSPMLRSTEGGHFAFCSGYNVKTKSHDFIYHEITGYAASLFHYLGHWTNDPKYKTVAKGITNYLTDCVAESRQKHDVGAVSHSRSLDFRSQDHRYFTFDNAM